MKLFRILRFNFFYELYENNTVLPFYFNIPNIAQEFYQKGSLLTVENNYQIVIVNCIPPYFSVGNKNIDPHYRCYSKSYRLGFGMDFRNYSSGTDFLRIQLGKKVYKNLRQDIQRLERNHAISFNIFYGDIDFITYNKLMETLKRFISVRFKGRTSKHDALNRWDFYMETVYDMISSKKASLFVLYESEQPIAISLNYHLNKILYVAIISFDTTFQRYSMGRQMFVKQIQWCFENNYQFLEMGWGTFDYKIKFSNAVYRLQTQVLYPKGKPVKKLIAFCISWFLQFKYYGVILRDRKFRRPESKFRNRWLKPLAME